MKQRYISTIVLLLICSCTLKAQAPLEFVENKGQWDGPFLYKSVTAGGDVYLETDGFTFMLGASDNGGKVHDVKHNLVKQAQLLKYHAYRLKFEGSGKPEKVTPDKLQQHYYNYFLGNKPEKWQTEIHPALSVDYKNLYHNVDLHVASEKGMLKYDLIVHPGADVSQVRLSYTGVEHLEIKNEKLEITTSVGIVKELQPYAIQYISGEKKQVRCRYRMKSGQVYFDFPSGYDVNEELIIDPTVVFATYTGSTADNWGFTATYDNQGNFYAGGIVRDVGYPVSLGAYQSSFGGGGLGGGNYIVNPTTNDTIPDMPADISITKFNPAGTNFIYSTYLGGSDNEQPHSLVVDGNNNLIVAGRTYSSNFPVLSGVDNSYNGNADIIVTKFNSSGTALLGSTYIGGSSDDGVNISSLYNNISGLKHDYGDDARSEVIVDLAGNIYLAASTQSADFPVTGNAYQGVAQGGQDAIVLKLNSSLSNLLWSSYIGGSNDDAAYVLALNQSQTSIYVSGGTSSTDFPSTSGTLHSSYQGGIADGFILRFSNGGAFALQKGTFIGMSDYDQSFGIQVDKQDKVYAMGQTLGGSFPTTPGVFAVPGSSQFIIKLDSDLSTSLYSTVFGSGNSQACNISPVAFLVDTCEQVYISGWGGPLSGNGGNTLNMPITPNAVKATTDGQDFYFIVLSKDATTLLYGTYYGGNFLGEHVDGGTSRFDKNGVVYQGICAGCGGSSAFPTTPGAFSNANGSGNCNLGALKIAFEFVLHSDAKAFPDTFGCAPLTVSFSNNSVYATSYLWDFGDGTQDTSKIPGSHTFNAPGVYTIKLMAFNSNACNQVADTDYITIIVDSTSVNSDFDFTIVNNCKPYQVSFTNTSAYSATPGSHTFTKFYWDFGDGTTFLGANPPLHDYPDTGTYIVTLVMVDSTSCNSPDSVKKIIAINNQFVTAAYIADSVCIGNSILFSNQSQNAQTLSWQFGDGSSSTAASPQYSYTTPGTYTVMLIAANPATCNKFDTSTQTVLVWPKPTADFIFDPVIPIPNEPIAFTNQSQNASSYFWGFGDGTSSTQENPKHLYKRTGTYKVCLEASNSFGCVDQKCKLVDAEIHPAIDVPTGFSPNGDGSNDILYVRGAAIETLNFKVYNRWGEKVFETTDLDRGWDGNFKGKPQEMEAYAWVLDATFVDGNTVHRTGNVTLLR